MPEFCKKHPETQLEIRKGKRNGHFVVCPECQKAKGKPEPEPKKPEPTPARAPEQKKNADNFWW